MRSLRQLYIENMLAYIENYLRQKMDLTNPEDQIIFGGIISHIDSLNDDSVKLHYMSIDLSRLEDAIASSILYGGPCDGWPVHDSPSFIEKNDNKRELIAVYRRDDNGLLRYVGWRHCCSDAGCGCRDSKISCKHNSGVVFSRLSPNNPNPEPATVDSIGGAL